MINGSGRIPEQAAAYWRSWPVIRCWAAPAPFMSSPALAVISWSLSSHRQLEQWRHQASVPTPPHLTSPHQSPHRATIVSYRGCSAALLHSCCMGSATWRYPLIRYATLYQMSYTFSIRSKLWHRCKVVQTQYNRCNS